MNKISKILFALAISTTAFLSTSCIAPSHESTYRMEEVYEHFPDISFEEMYEHVKHEDAIIIDVNSLESFSSGHIPTAISFFKYNTQILKLLPKDLAVKIIAYCGGPQCMAWKQAADLLHEAGYTNVYHYSDGLKGWKSNGGKLVN